MPIICEQRKANRRTLQANTCLVQAGCGNGCISIMLIDVQKGKVLSRHMPFAALLINPTDGMQEPPYRGLDFTTKSRLLVAEGCLELPDVTSRKCGREYFSWTGRRFTRVVSEK